MAIKDSIRQNIKKAAISLFTEDVLVGLIKWYRYTLGGEWRYIVFAVRRSYMMALIMEIITGIEMRVNSGDFLTDAALFLRCEEMASEYRKNGRFPKILLCDDAVIHGRGINHIIEGLRDNLVRILGDDFRKSEIEDALSRAIEIHVYVRMQGVLLLHGSYKLNSIRTEKPEFVHQFSSDCSAMILRSNLMNACYVYTEYLSDSQMERIKDRLIGSGGFVYTTYQKVEQYTKFFYLGEVNHIKVVLSLRIIKNVGNDGYRVAPFVFLPNLDSNETDILLDSILNKFPPKYIGSFLDLEKVNGKRTFNELITLLFSDAVLKSFNKAYKIELDEEDQDRELDKLARNYNQFGFEQTKQMLKELLGGDSVLTMSDIVEVEKTAISDRRIVLSLEGIDSVKLTNERMDKIKKSVEEYFFEKGCEDEEMAYELMRRPYYQTTLRSKRRVRGSCFTLKELNQGLTSLESKYCIAYFLQMIDAGIGGLSSYAPNNLEVIGYAQFVKAGEQSLLIKPLQLYEYLPVLSRMQSECGRRLRRLTDEIREFGIVVGWNESLIEKLVEFVDMLSRMGHTPRDWNGNYVWKIDKDKNDLWRLLYNQSFLREQYVEYAKDKYGYK